MKKAVKVIAVIMCLAVLTACKGNDPTPGGTPVTGTPSETVSPSEAVTPSKVPSPTPADTPTPAQPQIPEGFPEAILLSGQTAGYTAEELKELIDVSLQQRPPQYAYKITTEYTDAQTDNLSGTEFQYDKLERYYCAGSEAVADINTSLEPQYIIPDSVKNLEERSYDSAIYYLGEKETYGTAYYRCEYGTLREVRPGKKKYSVSFTDKTDERNTVEYSDDGFAFCSYDEEGRAIRTATYDWDGFLKKLRTVSYTPEGRVSGKTDYTCNHSSGVPVVSVSEALKYAYDEAGNIIESEVTRANVPRQVTKNRYSKDDSGRMVLKKSVTQSDDGQSSTVNHHIIYNRDGSVLCVKEPGPSGHNVGSMFFPGEETQKMIAAGVFFEVAVENALRPGDKLLKEGNVEQENGRWVFTDVFNERRYQNGLLVYSGRYMKTGNTCTYEYNAKGQLIKADENDAVLGNTEYRFTYDNSGRQLTRTRICDWYSDDVSLGIYTGDRIYTEKREYSYDKNGNHIATLTTGIYENVKVVYEKEGYDDGEFPILYEKVYSKTDGTVSAKTIGEPIKK